MTLPASVTEPPPTVTIRSALTMRAAAAASTTASRGVWGGMPSNSPAKRSPSAVRMVEITSVSLFSVRLTSRNTRCAPSRWASLSTTSAAGRPKTTLSMGT